MKLHLLVVSPHLDDAVLSVGQLLAGHPNATVLTLCTSDPSLDVEDALSEYDRRSGFETSRVAMHERRREDRRACSTLDVAWMHAGMVDSQYGAALDRDAVGDVLSAVVTELGRVRGRRIDGVQIVGPLGMLHPDHVRTRDAVLDVARAWSLPTFLFAELPYRVTSPFDLQPTIDDVQVGHAVELHEQFIGTGDRERKRLAVSEYRSQRWAIEPDHVMVPEIVFEVTFP